MMASKVGIIVIGRNEVEHLRRALASVATDHGHGCILYVDSGSTDGSVAVARSMGVMVHELDPGQPFSAARARREGVEVLLNAHPGIELIQFLDGDCELVDGWIETAATYLDQNPGVAVVCGMLAEKNPQASVYNRMSDQQWKLPAGEIQACGGIFMVRREVYEAIGGFDAVLVTREERDLCERIRTAGHRIIRLDKRMAWHDADLLRFGQWWSRAVWGGYGDAVEIGERKGRLNREQLHRIRRYLTWPIAMPLAMAGGLIAAWWSLWFLVIPVLGFLAYGVQLTSMMRWRMQCGDTANDALTYACLRLVRRFATSYGFVLYFLTGGTKGRRPDPHGASGPASRSEPTHDKDSAKTKTATAGRSG